MAPGWTEARQRSEMMAGKMMRMLLVAVIAITLAVGALAVTGGFGSSGATLEVSAIYGHMWSVDSESLQRHHRGRR
jgi:hypothetical protein